MWIQFSGLKATNTATLPLPSTHQPKQCSSSLMFTFSSHKHLLVWEELVQVTLGFKITSSTFSSTAGYCFIHTYTFPLVLHSPEHGFYQPELAPKLHAGICIVVCSNTYVPFYFTGGKSNLWDSNSLFNQRAGFTTNALLIPQEFLFLIPANK